MGYRVAAYCVDLVKINEALGSKDKRLYKRLLAGSKAAFESIDALDSEEDDEDGDVVEVDLSKSGQNLGDFLQKTFSGLFQGAPQPGKIRVKPNEDDPFFQDLEKKFTERIKEEFPGVNLDDLGGQGTPEETEEREDGARPRASCAEVLRHIIFGEEYNQGAGFKYGYVLEAMCEHYGERLEDAWAPMYTGSRWRKLVRGAFKAAGIPDALLGSLAKITERGSPITIPKIDDVPGIGYLRREEIAETGAAVSQINLDALKDRDVREGLEGLLAWFRACEESRRDLVCFYH